MKILKFDQFAALPAGTIFSYFRPMVCSGLYRKGEAITSDGKAIDFFESSLVAQCINGEPPTVDDIESRWGLFDYGAEFAVYEPADVAVLKSQLGIAQDEATRNTSPVPSSLATTGVEDHDELYEAAVKAVTDSRRASTSIIQRRLRIGYNRAHRLMELMEKRGVVGPENSSSPREILTLKTIPMETSQTITPPSHLVAKGHPSCSIFGDTRHEMIALVYLQALVALGDTWQTITPQQVRDACTAHGIDTVSHTLLADDVRLQQVMDAVGGPEKARKFSFIWSS